MHRPLPPRAGVGFKPAHFAHIAASRPDLGFFEVHAENYFVDGGPFHQQLAALRADYALSMHGVGLSIGGSEPLDVGHLNALKGLLDRYEPAVFSEHLAWSSHGGHYFNDLLPLPYNEETLASVCAHIDQTQSHLQRRILLENPATYVAFESSTMAETDFLSAIVERTGCGLLLDLNNLYVSSVNHGRDAMQALDLLPLAAVGEIHLAGHACQQDSTGAPLLIDDHGAAVAQAVWSLTAATLARTGPVATLIEWDNNVPPWERLYAEATRAAQYLRAPSASAT